MSGVVVHAESLSSTRLAYGNLGYLNRVEFEALGGEPGQTLTLAVGRAVFNVKCRDDVRPGTIQLGQFQRKVANVAMTDDIRLSPVRPDPALSVSNITLTVDLLTRGRPTAPIKLDSEKLVEAVSHEFANQMLKVNQEVCMEYEGTPLKLTVKQFSFVVGPESSVGVAVTGGAGAFSSEFGLFVKGSGVTFEKAKDTALELSGGTRKVNRIFDTNFTFEKLGIGGLDKEFSEIFRRAFASRLYPGLMRELGMTHVRGMLLYGPPGCGKSLIAAKIGEALKAREPKVVNGPEILNKYVGQSEENIRALFLDAEEDEKAHGDDSDLHIIIFDEIDAICKQRGSSKDGTGVHDSIVNQLLSKIQGVHSLNNILLIGMTNRKDMIDEALLRPGRLEVHVEIGLPDDHGRLSILKIHTQKFREPKKRIADDVDLADVAARTKNYTGAELEGLVKNALGYALDRLQTKGDITRLGDPERLCVTKFDFDRAIADTVPAFGSRDSDMMDCYPGGIIPYSAAFQRLMASLRTFSEQVAENDRTPLLSVLLEGPAGSGKSAVSAKCAVENAFPFKKRLTPETMVSMSEVQKAGAIHKVFEDAYKSPLSVIILDDLERLLDYVPLGQRFSNIVLQTLLVLCKRPPPKGHRLFILGTTSNSEILREMGLVDAFTVGMPIPLVSRKEEVLRVLSGATEVDQASTEAMAGIISEPVGIKKLLLALELAKQTGALTKEKFRDACTISGIDTFRTDGGVLAGAAPVPPPSLPSFEDEAADSKEEDE